MSESTSFLAEDVEFIYNQLRKASVIWSGRKEVLALSRKKVSVGRSKNGRQKTKFQWQCAQCFRWVRDEKLVEVDHIQEIGGVTGFNGDWNETIRRMFPRPVLGALQVLCIPCHTRKTGEFMAAIHKWKRKKNG